MAARGLPALLWLCVGLSLSLRPARAQDVAGAAGEPTWHPREALELKRAGDASAAAATSTGITRPAAAGVVVAQQQQQPLAWCANGVSWARATAFARFDMAGCLRISGIHVALTHLKTIVVLDRSDSNNTFLKLPGNRDAYAEELTVNATDTVYPFVERALDVKSNVFCSAGQLMPDGTVLSIGGSSDATNADPMANGSFSIRSFKPCTNKQCDFVLQRSMTSRRWYPTAQIMPNGRVLIVGGSNTTGNIAINAPQRNNPTVEYFPRAAGEGNFFLQFLVDTLLFNLYPFVHVLPSGRVFIFAHNRYTLFDSRSNQEVPGTYPPLNVTDARGVPVSRGYPVSGTSALFPLRSADNYTAEVMICGGSTTNTVYGPDRASGLRNVNNPADPFCWRIQPEARNRTWVRETMCNWPACNVTYPRVMGDAVLLADGSILIVNGAARGYQGLERKDNQQRSGYARDPQYQPLIYLPHNRTWYPSARLPPNAVPRLYHASALLLWDATVLITGSNPNPFRDLSGTFPTEFRIEKFVPPYLMTGLARPNITRAPSAITMGSLNMFSILITATQNSTTPLASRFTVGLAYPGFSTHNQRHGMRHVFLDIAAVARTSGSGFLLAIRGPPNNNVCPPSIYWLHVLDNGIPAIEAPPVNVTMPA